MLSGNTRQETIPETTFCLSNQSVPAVVVSVTVRESVAVVTWLDIWPVSEGKRGGKRKEGVCEES